MRNPSPTHCAPAAASDNGGFDEMERKLALVALFAALVAALGLLPKLTIAGGVPITAQSLGIMLCGTVLGARWGGLAALLFVGLVALGLPILAGGRGGIGLFLSPSAGFLAGFPVAAFSAGLVVESWRSPRMFIVATTASVAGGIVVLYAFGIPGMALALDLTIAEAAPLALPFLPGDAIKAVVCGLVTHGIWRARPEAILARSQR